LVAEGDDLLFDFAQLTELRIAVGSPSAPIENENSLLSQKQIVKISRFSFQGSNGGVGRFGPNQDWLYGLSGIGYSAVGRQTR